ncbi:MAG: caspase family protein [Litoreibacter sp.]
MAKKALCIGINNYPGLHNDLNGCINDMNDWSALLSEEFGFNVSQLADAKATSDAILTSLANLIDGADEGDALTVTISCHGTYILDGADADEADNYDEAICAYDRNILDDEIRNILTSLSPKVNLTVISDSCHSESNTRTRMTPMREGLAIAKPQYPMLRRYMPMENHKKSDTMRVPRRNRSFSGYGAMNHLLLSGCTATQYSYDAWINERYNGAMSANAIALIKEDPEVTYQELFVKLRLVLPSRYFPQDPQLEGPEALRNRKLFS